ncbi:MAG: MgtC/SapB family protein, partial [Candidatus Aminicenantes bacterium]|nr:MgtC/SapB family protein [Candidatus Aminicenantes bacterium]
MEHVDIVLKLVLAVALGGLIGLEREARDKPAGLRTNILVCLGSTMLMTLAVGIAQAKGGGGDSLVRLAAAVATGIGFLGAGAIMQSRGMIHGLTTASTIWVVAALGLVIGAGYYVPALVFTLVVIGTLLAFRKFEEKYHRESTFRYSVRLAESPELLARLRRMSFHHGVKMDRVSLRREGRMQVLTFTLIGPEDKEREFSRSLAELGDIEELKVE